jgi:ABC-type multidrug transport system fused ATPase/permease subunit
MINKLNRLLSKEQKSKLYKLLLLMFLGMVFEMGGLGILLPILKLISDIDGVIDYPIVNNIFMFIGGVPSHQKIVIGVLSFLIIYYVFKSVFLAFLSWKQSLFISNLSADISNKLFMGYLKQPYSFHLIRNSSSLISNIQVEVTQFTLLTQSIIYLTLEISVVIGVLVILFLSDIFAATCVLLLLGTASYIFYLITKGYIKKLGIIRQDNSEKMNQHLMQGLGGVKDIKLIGLEDYFSDKFNIYNFSLARIVSKVTTLNLLPRLYLELLAIIALALILIVKSLSSTSISDIIPTLGVFVAAAFRMIPSSFRILSSIQNIRYSEPVINILSKEIELISSNHSDSRTNEKYIFNNKIELKNISFKYPNAKNFAVNNVTLEITRGQSVGFIGLSGSGKSTLIDIILGLLQPVSGNIYVDEKDIYECIHKWQNLVGYVPQSIYLTDTSLKENIAFGVPLNLIDEKALMKAVKLAQLEMLINDLPEGLDTYVGERGVRLSGGQKQRIGIARALYRDPDILVLDEATSALDMDTESQVMESIDNLHGKKTILIIAHRLSTIAKCDNVFKLHNGSLILV